MQGISIDNIINGVLMNTKAITLIVLYVIFAFKLLKRKTKKERIKINDEKYKQNIVHELIECRRCNLYYVKEYGECPECSTKEDKPPFEEKIIRILSAMYFPFVFAFGKGTISKCEKGLSFINLSLWLISMLRYIILH